MIRNLTEAELPQLFAVRKLAFFEPKSLQDAETLARYQSRLPHTRGYFDGDTLTSTYTMFPFEMYVGGMRVKMGGLAGVASAPEYRRRGYVAELLKDGLTRLHEAGVGWCLEYPFDPRFYARYGWQSVGSGFLLEVPSDRFQRGAPEAVRLSPEETEQLRPIYEEWAKRYHFTLTRDDEARPGWDRLVSEDELVYTLGDAYCLLGLSQNEREERTELEVYDYAFSSPEGRRALVTFLGSFHGQADLIRLHMPSDEPLLLDLQPYLVKNEHALQARVVDVAAALTPLSSSAEASFTVSVRDEVCNWNDGAFQVSLGDQSEVTKVQSAAPDLSLDIRALPLLLSGVSAEAVARAGLLEGDLSAAKALATLARGRTSFMPLADYF